MASTVKHRQLNRQVADLTMERSSAVEFKRVRWMSGTPLQKLDRSIIEIELEIGGALRSVTGEGRYVENDRDLGRVLRILVRDPAGDFELLLREGTWDGRLEPSQRSGCEWRISLVGRQACAN
jgi:hypothetical protein